jgi:hypothetical protein
MNEQDSKNGFDKERLHADTGKQGNKTDGCYIGISEKTIQSKFF